MEIPHDRFGRCVFEKDEAWKVLKLVNPPMPFGRHEEAEIELDVPEEKVTEALWQFARVYDQQELYLKKFYDGILSFCDEWEETDSEGNAITMELVERNSHLFHIQIREAGNGTMQVSLNGMVFDDEGEDLLGCHSVIMEIDGGTGEVEYDLEG